jgi:outer membrane protein TolC
MRIGVLTTFSLAIVTLQAFGQQQQASLKDLLIEGERNNPEILNARRQWQASTHVSAQAGSLPDPQFTLQDFSVGSPRPGAGLANSNFAYVGFGASQDVPYPGKLRLKAATATRATGEQLAQVDVVRAKVAQDIKVAYLRLAYLQQTMTLLNASRSTLSEVVETEMARYRAGQGSQLEVLKAQLERTKLIREITMHHEDVAQTEAELKGVLNRSQESPDLVVDELQISPFKRGLTEILESAKRHNPLLSVDLRSIATRESELESARFGAKPDFTVGYMFQRTGLDFPAYYMATLTLTLPRKSRVHSEEAEASDRLSAALLGRDQHIAQQLAEVRKQYAAVVSTQEELDEFKDGLLPQAETAYESIVAALRSNKQPVEAVLASLNDVLQLRRDYYQALFEHETALVNLEQLTGEILR